MKIEPNETFWGLLLLFGVAMFVLGVTITQITYNKTSNTVTENKSWAEILTTYDSLKASLTECQNSIINYSDGCGCVTNCNFSKCTIIEIDKKSVESNETVLVCYYKGDGTPMGCSDGGTDGR